MDSWNHRLTEPQRDQPATCAAVTGSLLSMTQTAQPAMPLSGVRVVEISSFVAVPLAGMTLAQLGAEVIRVDPVGGAADYRRSPRTAPASTGPA